MASVVYNSFKSGAMKADFNLGAAGQVGVLLVRSDYTPNIDTDIDLTDISYEASGAGYTAGGITLSSTTVITDTTDDEGAFDAADATWSTSTITARGAVLYKRTGTASTSLLIGYFDFGSDKSSSAGDFTLQWNSEGLLNLG